MPLQKFTYYKVEYYVDYRMRQFRTTATDKPIKFIDFEDDKGDRMLTRMISLDIADMTQIYL